MIAMRRVRPVIVMKLCEFEMFDTPCTRRVDHRGQHVSIWGRVIIREVLMGFGLRSYINDRKAE